MMTVTTARGSSIGNASASSGNAGPGYVTILIEVYHNFIQPVEVYSKVRHPFQFVFH
jgi:hypothetical protein